MDAPPADEWLGRRTLILGDVNTGKTTRCRQILAALCQQGLGVRIGVIDMAPHIPEALARQRGLVGAGGNLVPPPGSGVLDLRAHLDAPRLSSRTEDEAQAKAGQNARILDALLAQLPHSGRDILFINDVTLYLQAGKAGDLLQRIGAATLSTLVVNGYSGERLGGGALTQREKVQTDQLRQYFEQQGQVVTLTKRYA